MVLIHLRVGRSLFAIPRRPSRESDAPEDYCLFLKVNALNGRGLHLVSQEQAFRFGRKYRADLLPTTLSESRYISS